ncbi:MULTISPECIES: M23 family metallopeptidase [unclassified Leucobacter]|jgi:murein DD-endopeptidase MepM/ murein hydrolase activator NlpD|uniref:M23 family metallopeptidase n=1 Tax=unclassified Leucobacter TaxID=2621730 RepID=UPI0030164D67
MNTQQVYLTPMPSFDFLSGGTGGGARHRRARRSFIATATAALSVAGLMSPVVFPTPFAPVPGAAAAELPAQQLVSGPAAFEAAGLDAIGAVEVQAAPVAPQRVNAEQGLVDPSRLTDTKLRYPFDQTMPLTDGFGYRTVPVEQFHDAQDIAAANGTPIRIIGDGVVVEAGWANDGCGFSLKVQHLVDGQDLTSRYCHMEGESHAYQVGDRVRSGDEAGRVGNTGLSFGAHLHLALRLNGEPIDPLPFIEANAQ